MMNPQQQNNNRIFTIGFFKGLVVDVFKYCIDFCRRNIILSLIVTFLLIITTGSVSSYKFVLEDDDEVAYKFSVYSTCQEKSVAVKASSCFSIYTVKVGNTGENIQNHIQVTLADMPMFNIKKIKVLDIIGNTGEPKTEPHFDFIEEEDKITINITDLLANQMVNLELWWFGQENYNRLKTLKTKIEANGQLIEGDPKMSSFLRMIYGIFDMLF